MDIIIREVKKEDKEAINDLFEKLLSNHGCNYGIGHGYPDYIYNKIFDEEQSYNAFVAALLNKDKKEIKTVGYIMLELNKRDRHSFIQGLFIEEEYRKQGIAKRLVNEVEKYSKGLGFNSITAEARQDVFIDFYRNLGYSIKSRKNDATYWIFKALERERKQDDELEL